MNTNRKHNANFGALAKQVVRMCWSRIYFSGLLSMTFLAILFLTGLIHFPIGEALAATLTITKVAPQGGVPGSNVTIVGSGFLGATAVTFNGTPAATFTVSSNSVIKATVPVGVTTGPVSVTTPGGTATSSFNFSLTDPVINIVAPRQGIPGYPAFVTIVGRGFTGTNDVEFNGSPTTFTVVSDHVIRAPIPDTATTGPVTITTPAGTVTSAFDFTRPDPLIRSVVAGHLQAGQPAHIIGRWLPALSSLIVNNASVVFTQTRDTVITFIVPPGVPADAASVQVTYVENRIVPVGGGKGLTKCIVFVSTCESVTVENGDTIGYNCNDPRFPAITTVLPGTCAFNGLNVTPNVYFFIP